MQISVKCRFRNRRNLNLVTVILGVIVSTTSCGSSFPSAKRLTQVEPSPSATVDIESLCDKLVEIRVLPHKDEPINDPAYNALLGAGEKAIPCLIRRITDTTPMRDPRTAPGYTGIDNRVGDVALWVLIDITKLDFVQLLPSHVQEDFKDEGVLAYFKYVQHEKHRKILQDKLYQWYRKKYGKDAA